MAKLKYANETCNRFVRDMERAGMKPYHYRGRFFWQGPAVNVEGKSRDEVARATKVKLQQDDMGLGLVVYPVESGGAPCEPS